MARATSKLRGTTNKNSSFYEQITGGRRAYNMVRTSKSKEYREDLMFQRERLADLKKQRKAIDEEISYVESLLKYLYPKAKAVHATGIKREKMGLSSTPRHRY